MTNAEQPRFQSPNPAALPPETGPREYSPVRSSLDTPIERVLDRHESDLLAIPGVVMVSHRLVEPRGEAIIVGVTDAGVLGRLPHELEGIPVRGEVTGSIDAY